MCRRYLHRATVAVTIITIVLAGLPSQALADGGPVLSDPALWAQIEEGQQIAVVNLGQGSRARVDLFISMLDRTGESHQVVFFLPLGMQASDFLVSEKTSLQFDNELTEQLDSTLLRETQRLISYRSNVRWALLLGTGLINGAWTWPFWFLWSLVSCAPATQLAPMATYETESSQVAIYGTDEDTDLQALIGTTGLDPAVAETLARLRGQQIAVVTLQTQPPADAGGPAGRPTGQPGIHLSWTTTLVSQSAEARYAYPLGTGSAWAHPIEITRLYVVAPPGQDFRVEYPELGPDQSGFAVPFMGQPRPRIMDVEGPAYSVEDVVGDFGRIWRVTYLTSNSAEDVVITRLPDMSAETLAALKRPQQLARVLAISYVVSLGVALLVWVLTWGLVMPRLLQVQYHWRDPRLYRHAIGWALLYPLTNGAVLGVAMLLTTLTIGLALALGAPVLLFTLLGGVSVVLFAQWSSTALGVPRRRAALAYIGIVFITNVVYGFFAVLYATWLGLA